MTQGVEAPEILVVDDAQMTLDVIRRNLQSRGFAVTVATNVASAVEHLERRVYELVITDLKMPGADGLELIKHVRDNHPGTETVMITGYASIDGAVEAMKSGAEEYLTKPFTDEELFSAVEQALARRRERCLANGRVGSYGPLSENGMIGTSGPMQRIYRDVDKIARSLATVMVTGDSGTGKEMIARAIHYRSDRAAAPFVAVNCCSIPEPLMESELFGHVRGAFTGASTTRAGFFQTADGGTIFLDEIGDMGLSMQARLLRVLQDCEVCMVGSTKPRNVDVRIVAATNKDLTRLVEKGRFREDLFFRLNVLTVHVPALRERGDDVLLLINHFAAKFAEELGRPTPTFTDAALQALGNYSWPGNVRELENTIQRLVVMCDGDRIDVADLPRSMRHVFNQAASIDRTLSQVEAEHIREVLVHLGGNLTRAARVLGIDRKTLRDKIKRYEIAIGA